VRELLGIGVIGSALIVVGYFVWLAVKWVLVAVGVMGG